MNAPIAHRNDIGLLGIGFYSVAEAARLLGTPVANIRRWMSGYRYRQGGVTFSVPALWTSQIPAIDDRVELGFRDLIELRFVTSFIEAGLGLKTIRNCLDLAKNLIDDERPFSTLRFRTDGTTIFLQSLSLSGETQVLDLRKGQFVFQQVMERSFRDLDIEADAVARWRPYKGKASIVVDPDRAFGQPVATLYGVTTVALADAVEAEGSVARVAQLFEVPQQIVRDAVGFENSLRAA